MRLGLAEGFLGSPRGFAASVGVSGGSAGSLGFHSGILGVPGIPLGVPGGIHTRSQELLRQGPGGTKNTEGFLRVSGAGSRGGLGDFGRLEWSTGTTSEAEMLIVFCFNNVLATCGYFLSSIHLLM